MTAAASQIEQVGRWILTALLVGGIACTFAAPWVGPPLLLLALPVGLLGLLGVAAVIVRPVAGVATALLLSLLLVGYGDQSNLGALLFAGYFAAYVVLWYGSRLLAGVPIVRSRTDAVVLVFIVAGLAGGVLLGVLMGGNLTMLIGETRSFGMLALYFPVRELVRAERRGPQVAAVCILVLGVGVTGWNAYSVWQAFQSADALWKIIDVRTAYGETTLSLALLVSLAMLLAVTRRRSQIAVAGLVGTLMIGLLLTKSRAYWVACIVGVVALMATLPTRERRDLIRLGLVVIVSVGVVAVVALGDYVVLIAVGIGKRFLTLGSAGTADVSLINRFYETKAAWDLVQQNPIVGYGFGVPFVRYDLVLDGTLNWSFIHNGYVGTWLKLGLWGVTLLVVAWIACGVNAFRAARSGVLDRADRALGAAAMGTLVTLAITANTSNPFLQADQTFTVMLTFALASGLAQRADDQQTRVQPATA